MGSKEVSTDVLVIGGGPAACFAAIKAREAGCNRVTMVCKAVAGSSGSAVYLMGNLRDWREDEIKGLIPQMLAELEEGLLAAPGVFPEFTPQNAKLFIERIQVRLLLRLCEDGLFLKIFQPAQAMIQDFILPGRRCCRFSAAVIINFFKFIYFCEFIQFP